MNTAGDDAKRSFAEEWRFEPRGDDDAGGAGMEERRFEPRGDDDAGITRGGPAACGGERGI